MNQKVEYNAQNVALDTADKQL